MCKTAFNDNLNAENVLLYLNLPKNPLIVKTDFQPSGTDKIHYLLAIIFLPTFSTFFSEKVRKLQVTTEMQPQDL